MLQDVLGLFMRKRSRPYTGALPRQTKMKVDAALPEAQLLEAKKEDTGTSQRFT